MNLNFLINELLPQRKKEIENGDNLATRQPIYVVLNLRDCYVSGHSDYSPPTNLKGLPFEYGYIDEEEIETEFSQSDEGMVSPKEVTKFFIDEVVAFFLTSKGAHEYLKYQNHNLINPYVYVFNSGYRNFEMDSLLNNE